MKEPQIIAGDLSESELRKWLQVKAAQSGGLESLRLEIVQFRNEAIPCMVLFAGQLRGCINGLISSEVCRTEDSASRAVEEAASLEKVEQSLIATLELYHSLIDPDR